MKKALLALSLLCLISSCTTTSNGITNGLYTSWKDRDPISRVDNSVASTKTGKACVTNVLGLIVRGDSSIEAAKKAGGINKVSYVDRTLEGVQVYAPIYLEGCTVVHGN